MIHYILQMLAFQLLFLAVYDFFLKKETFYNLNRIYLLLTPILGFVLPLIRLNYIKQNIPQEYIIKLPTVLIGDSVSGNATVGSSIWLPSLMDIWMAGMLIGMLFFSYKFYKILKLKFSGNKERFQGFKLITLPNTDAAFSFFKTIYLGENLSEENRMSIIAHEKIHIQQKHSLDLLFFEVLRIVFWFNPLVYLFQNRVSALHEYIADAEVTDQKNKKEYYLDLLSQVFQTDKISFINTFFNHSLTRLTVFGKAFVFGTLDGQVKKRIVMLQKSKSPKILQLKYILLFPIICGMLVYTSCSDEPKAQETSTVSKSDSEIMNKINELSEAIMKKGEMTPEEEKALKFLTTEAQPGDKVYTSVQEYLDATNNQKGKGGPVVIVDTIHSGKKITDVPFSVIEKVPAYPGCSGADNEAMKMCMSQHISQFIGDNFNTKLGKDLGLLGRQRIAVQFKIDKEGNVVDVRARAPKPELEAEAIRVVKMLPQMQPGEQKGKKVGVLYSLPIVFNIEE